MGFNTSYPKILVKINEVWYESKLLDYLHKSLAIVVDKELEFYEFAEVQEFRVIWEG